MKRGRGKKGEGSTLSIEETVKLVLGILGIVILISLSVALVGIFTEKNDLIKAQRALEDIKGIVEGLEEGETKEYVLEGPKDLHVWSVKEQLCICKKSIDEDSTAKKEICLKRGVCEAINISIIDSCVGDMDCLDLKDVPLQIWINSQDNFVFLSSFSGSLEEAMEKAEEKAKREDPHSPDSMLPG